MTSLKVKFRPSSIEGCEGKIYYQIIHDRNVRQWCTTYKIFNHEWDNRKSTVSIPHNNQRNTFLLSVKDGIKHDTERLARIISKFSSTKATFTADEIIDEFVIEQQQQSFFNFMGNNIIRLRKMGKRRTSETYTTAYNSFRTFINDEIIFRNIDSDLMEAYQAHLQRKGLIPNSISFHMRILRAVYNRAVEKGLTDDKKPFRHVYTGIDKTIKRAINISALKKIKEIDLSMYPAIDYARDIFLLSFYLRGMSFVDMAYLRKSALVNGHISYRRRKTGQQLVIKWTKEMQAILNKYSDNPTDYLLPIITSAAKSDHNQYRAKQYNVNNGLKTIAKYIGLNMPLTLYCARHSWASIAKAKGIPVGVISDGLGHDSELTTQIYLSTLDTSAVDRANALIMKSL